VSLVGAGPGAKDLITLRGVQRLQEADVIFYDRLVDPAVLELARRDAERVYVGKAPGCHSWPQEKITQTLVRAAQRGQRIVRLKCGDPGIFARSCEEIAALKDAGIPYEIVPGVTSACAAAAASAEPLTEREEIDTVIVSTGHLTTEYTVPECVKDMKSGTCVTLYMAVGVAPAISEHFNGTSVENEISVVVVAHAQTPKQVIIRCDLPSLPAALAQNGIKDTALITLKRRKSQMIIASPAVNISLVK
jgi:uroporphyrin-III C-methyltransferase/precorrin-2 dehydrogenase/sirohydrochlorin ferrochelatase